MLKKYKQEYTKIISNEGVLPFIKKVIRYIASKTVYIKKLIIFERDLQIPIKKIDIQKNLFFKIATKNEFDSISTEAYGYDKNGIKYCKKRYSKGDRCILTILDDEVVGYIWLMNKEMELSLYKHLPISSEIVYAYKAFMLNKYRGKGIYSALIHYLIKLLRDEGKKFIIANIDKHYIQSFKPLDKMGFKEIGKIINFRFFGLKYDYISKKDMKYLQRDNSL